MKKSEIKKIMMDDMKKNGQIDILDYCIKYGIKQSRVEKWAIELGLEQLDEEDC